MKNKTNIFSSIIGVVCGALSYWFNSYNEMYVGGINIYYLMGVLAFLSVVAIGFIYKKHVFSLPLYFCIGFLISVLGRIFFDISNDPSSHNLFPFEIIFVLVIIVPSSFAGLFLINFINKKTNTNANNA